MDTNEERRLDSMSGLDLRVRDPEPLSRTGRPEASDITNIEDRGVTAEFLAWFTLNFIPPNARTGKNAWTTRKVHSEVIMKQTQPDSSRFVKHYVTNFIQTEGLAGLQLFNPCVGKSTRFVSHSWDSPWYELVDAICRHSAEAKALGRAEYYWVDILVVNQHFPWHVLQFFYNGADKEDMQSLPLDQMTQFVLDKRLTTTGAMNEVAGDMMKTDTLDDLAEDTGFKRVISATDGTLVFMEPWDSPRPATRVWCLFETYTCVPPRRRLTHASSFGATAQQQPPSAARSRPPRLRRPLIADALP